MGVYEFLVGIGTIIFISLVWTLFAHQTDMLEDIFTGMTSILDVQAEYAKASDIMYISLLVISIIVFAWILKRGAMEQEKNPYA